MTSESRGICNKSFVNISDLSQNSKYLQASLSLHRAFCRTNYELNELIVNADIVRFIESRRIVWLGHVMRMDDKRTPKKILEWKPIGTRIRGRPMKRWIVDTEEDRQIIGIKVWRKQCKERAEWKRIAEKAKTHRGL